MKGVFITIFGVLTFLFLYRYVNGLETLTVSEIISLFNEYKISVSESFTPFKNSVEQLVDALRSFSTFGYVEPSGNDILDFLKKIYAPLQSLANTIRAIALVLGSIFYCVILLLTDTIDLLSLVGSLLFW